MLFCCETTTEGHKDQVTTVFTTPRPVICLAQSERAARPVVFPVRIILIHTDDLPQASTELLGRVEAPAALGRTFRARRPAKLARADSVSRAG